MTEEQQDALNDLKDSVKMVQHTIGRVTGILDLNTVGLDGWSGDMDEVMFDVETELNGEDNE